MASYNGERFIVEAVESVLAQSFGDFELIISDDGSTDGTVELARSLADRDPQRIRVLTGQHNQVSRSRSTGRSRCDAER